MVHQEQVVQMVVQEQMVLQELADLMEQMVLQELADLMVQMVLQELVV